MPKQGTRLTVASQTFQGARGGIGRVSDLTARVGFEAQYPMSLLSVQDEGGTHQSAYEWKGCGGSRLKFVAACSWAALRGDRILYDQLGTGRGHVWPAALTRPMGVWIHGIEVWEQLRPDRLKVARRAAFMIANTHYTRERATNHDAVFQSARVCWLATAEDEPPLEPARLDGPPIVLILGRLDQAEYKGHRELIEAWPSVVAGVPKARLVIAGGGLSLGRYRSLAAASPAAGNIDVLGFVPESKLPEIWSQTVLFAMPSRGEGFGLAYIEAMRWRIPVIASVHDAGPEVNVHGETGLNVDLDRRDELANSIITILRDRDLALRMGLTGQRRWREHFSYSAFRTRFLAELETFVAL